MWYSSAIVICDVRCEWQKRPPRYRLFVNGELFVERCFVWQQQYLEEIISMWVNPGDYRIEYQIVPGHRGLIHVENMRVEAGPPGAVVYNNQWLKIPAPL